MCLIVYNREKNDWMKRYKKQIVIFLIDEKLFQDVIPDIHHRLDEICPTVPNCVPTVCKRVPQYHLICYYIY